MNLKILVTGGAGFIGSHICEKLLESNPNITVRVIDNLTTGKMENITHLLQNKHFEFIKGDITDVHQCKKAVANINIICHQAAVGSVPKSINDPLTSHNTNVNGFLNMLIAAKDAGVKRVVFASSSSVYGESGENGAKVENKTGRLLSPYAVTKYVDELYASVFTTVYGLECIGLRYFNVFGPRQDPNAQYAAVIPKFIRQIMNGNESPTINGDGSISRDFTHVDNVVHANVLAMMTTNRGCFGEVFNVGSGGSVTVLGVFEKIAKLLGKDIGPIFGPGRVGDVKYSSASVDKATDMLGYSVQVTFDDGLSSLVGVYLDEYKKSAK